MPAILAHPAGEVKTSPHYPAGSWPLAAGYPWRPLLCRVGRSISRDSRGPTDLLFFQFLQAGGRWAAFLRDCPLYYAGNRGSGAINFMGNLLELHT